MQQIEDRFNAQARYPWTFLCDEPLTEDFKTYFSNLVLSRASPCLTSILSQDVSRR
ncbi:hypothetical protein EDB83DRAFT_2342490 [Lactarius deliciosus]|nr:hypothetical protein EDB83DRAFT_2342490 [Lactarius deliciosus]